MHRLLEPGKEPSSNNDILPDRAVMNGARAGEFYEPESKDVKMGFVVTVNGILMDQLRGIDTQLNEATTSS
jgi:hypothetical protein